MLFASLLEAITLRPAIVLVPGHAFVGWQRDPTDAASWEYLETTVVSSSTFEEASTIGNERAKAYAAAAAEAPNCLAVAAAGSAYQTRHFANGVSL